MTDERPDADPMALALEWATKITTVGLEMVLPAVGGGYLDRRLNTTYWTLIGGVLGVVVGMWHLLLMTRPKNGGGSSRKRTSGGSSDK